MVKDLLKCGFVEIEEKDIPEYTGEKDISSYKNEDIYDFGYLDLNNFCIIKLYKEEGDGLFYIDGSNGIIIKIADKLYFGNWNEGYYSLKDDVSICWAKNSCIFDEFYREMKKFGIDSFYCANF